MADEEVHLPAVLGQLITTYIGHDQPGHLDASPWLLPGPPTTAKQLRRLLQNLGVSRLGSVAALDELAGEIPSPLLAEVTGYHPKVIANRAATLGTA